MREAEGVRAVRLPQVKRQAELWSAVRRNQDCFCTLQWCGDWLPGVTTRNH